MRSLVVYYSYSGHAEKIARHLADALAGRGTVTVERLLPVREVTTFLGQCRAAFARERAPLREGCTYDASPFDLVVIGCPVWAFAPVPAVNTWLDKVNGLSGKRAIVFLTSGSGAGVTKCFRDIRTVLESKGIAHIAELNVPDRKSGDAAFIDVGIEKAIAEAVI